MTQDRPVAPEAEGLVTTCGTDRPGPLFISGRQHSGNTMTAVVFSRVPDCLVVNTEGWFFERRAAMDRMRDPAARAGYLVDILRLEDPRLSERARAHLVRWHQRHPSSSSVELYREAMRFAAAESGCCFWVRRATSYIFHAEEILDVLPEARIIYLLRNPYDICASLKRRNAPADRFAAMVMGWKRGLRTAARLRSLHPRRLFMARYEDIVLDPVATFQTMFEFAGVPFREEYLDVPHVNRSEAKQARTSDRIGIAADRLYYYRAVLTQSEIAAVDMLAGRSLEVYYPELPHRGEPRPVGSHLKALGLLALSPYRAAAHQVRLLARQDPAWRMRHLLRRIRALFR